MSITTSNAVSEYVANGSATDFVFEFYLPGGTLPTAIQSLDVYLDGVLKTYTTDYTVTYTPRASSGTVVFNTAPIGSTVVRLELVPPQTQEVVLVEGGDLPAITLTDMADKLTLLVQSLQAQNEKTKEEIEAEIAALGAAIAAIVSGGGGGGSGQLSWISVLATGAVAGGIIDCTTAFRNAMILASAIGTIVYVPGGTYRVTGQLSNVLAPNCRGFIGDSATSSLVDMSEIATDGVKFLNPPVGCRFEHIRFIGPGQFAPVTAIGLSLPVDSFSDIGISFQSNFVNVTCEKWPTAGFYWQLPIVSTFSNCIAQECGDFGFNTDVFESEFVGGTSTQFNACYANNVIGKGYYFKGHGYSVLSSCAADNCGDSYYLKNCFGMTIQSCGSEVNTYVSDDLPGRAVVLDGCSGITIDAIWTYNMPNVKSLQIDIIASINVMINSVSSYEDTLIEPTYNAHVDADSLNIMFLNNRPTDSDFGPIDPTFQINNEGSQVIVIGDGQMQGISFSTPDEFGNSFYVLNGAFVVNADPGLGSVNLFQTLLFDFPILSLTNEDGGTIYWGDGTAPADTTLGRTAAGELTVGSNLVVAGNLSADTTLGLKISDLDLSTTEVVVTGDIVLTGWDTTTITYNSGGKTYGSIGLNAAGAPGANPTMKVPYPSAWDFTPHVLLTTFKDPTSGAGQWVLLEENEAYFIAYWEGTPAAGQSYAVNYLVGLGP